MIQLAAQTLQAFFTGGGQAREHAEYPLADVVFRAPVLRPPSIRIFDDAGDFTFANPAAIKADGEDPGVPGAERVERVAGIIGADGAIGGFTPFIEWVAPQLHGAKQRDFALTLGPVVTTPDEGDAAQRRLGAARSARGREHGALSRRPDRPVKMAIVGAGVMGCATAWALSERGAEVAVHEQFGLDHDRGSSHGRTRIFRVAYPEAHWVRFAQEAYAGWNELDPGLLGLYGLIELVADPALTSARTLDECGVRYRLLDRDEVRAHGAVLPDGWTALHVADAGVVFADRARHAFLESAGVEVETNRRIESTDELDADVVVVTAGSWIGELVADVPVKVTRETIAYFKREGPPSAVDRGPRRGDGRPRDVLALRSGARAQGRCAPRRRRGRPGHRGAARTRRSSSASRRG